MQDHLVIRIPYRHPGGRGCTRITIINVEIGVRAGRNRCDFHPDHCLLPGVVPALDLVIVRGRGGGVIGEPDIRPIGLGIREIKIRGVQEHCHREVAVCGINVIALDGDHPAAGPVGIPPCIIGVLAPDDVLLGQLQRVRIIHIPVPSHGVEQDVQGAGVRDRQHSDGNGGLQGIVVRAVDEVLLLSPFPLGAPGEELRAADDPFPALDMDHVVRSYHLSAYLVQSRLVIV